MAVLSPEEDAEVGSLDPGAGSLGFGVGLEVGLEEGLGAEDIPGLVVLLVVGFGVEDNLGLGEDLGEGSPGLDLGHSPELAGEGNLGLAGGVDSPLAVDRTADCNSSFLRVSSNAMVIWKREGEKESCRMQGVQFAQQRFSSFASFGWWACWSELRGA